MSTELVPIADIERMASAIAKSGFFGVKTVEQAVALMLIAQAEGLHPAIAARDYNVIQGRPALKADAMLARFQQAGGSVQWTELTDKRVAGTFSHPQGGSVSIDWDMNRAKAAGLDSKDNYKKWPRQMLRARCISEGIRTVYPGVLSGMYTPEEVQDFDVRPAQEPPQQAEVIITNNDPAPKQEPPKAASGNGRDKDLDKFMVAVDERWKWFNTFHAKENFLRIQGTYGVEKIGEIPAAKRTEFLAALDKEKEAIKAAHEAADKLAEQGLLGAEPIDAEVTAEVQAEFEGAGL